MAHELELEIKQCSQMILSLESRKEPLWIDLGTSDATKIEIGEIRLTSEKDVVCGHTGEPCVLYRGPRAVFGLRRINYHLLKRCPSIAKGNSKETVVKYKFGGIKSGPTFRASKINRLGK